MYSSGVKGSRRSSGVTSYLRSGSRELESAWRCASPVPPASAVRTCASSCRFADSEAKPVNFHEPVYISRRKSQSVGRVPLIESS